MAVVGAKRKFTIIVKVNTHIRKTDPSVVYTNDPVVLENTINAMKQLLVDDDQYKVVGFDLEYTSGRVEYDQKLAVTQSCVRHYVIVYHYCLSTRPCECFTNPDY
ncbi:hypothetical protein D1007_20455 [Hordeum vulgare]|nr:hypothetical protein D1007_20455 [Hordeum vulgare]